MPFDWGTFLALALLGGLVAVDGTSFGQFMVSRPFVAATLAGWLAGAPIAGAAIGIVLEAFHLAVLPVGAAKYPDGGPPAVVAGALYATSDTRPSTLLILVLGTLILERVAGETVHGIRLANVRLIPTGHGDTWSAAKLERRHVAAIGLDFGRGMLLVIGGTLILLGVVRFIVPLWGMSENVAGILISAATAGMLASAFRLVGSRIWFAVGGFLLGVVLLLLTR